jgi:peroxiredoxin
MTPRISVGDRVPQATLGRIVDGVMHTVELHELIAGRNAVIAGVPGAFTPVCTCRHIPDLLENAARLRAAGYGLVACVAPNSPWAVAAWAAEVDPSGSMMFLSDGNLMLARALGVTVAAHEMMLGETSARYLLATESGLVRRLNVETKITNVDCTRARDVLIMD